MNPRAPRVSSRSTNAKLLFVFVLLPVALLAASSTRAPGQAAAKPPAANLANGKALYAKTCVTCHGDRAQGKKEVFSPALHRQEDWYLTAQLMKFRAGQRGADPKDAQGVLMRPMAVAIPDEQGVRDLAAYVSSLDGPLPTPEVKGDVAAGKATYDKICATCHGPGALGKPEVKSPALVGQNDWYVVSQLQKFRSGLRGADPKDVTGAQMRAIAMSLTGDQALKDVAAYIATLK